MWPWTRTSKYPKDFLKWCLRDFPYVHISSVFRPVNLTRKFACGSWKRPWAQQDWVAKPEMVTAAFDDRTTQPAVDVEVKVSSSHQGFRSFFKSYFLGELWRLGFLWCMKLHNMCQPPFFGRTNLCVSQNLRPTRITKTVSHFLFRRWSPALAMAHKHLKGVRSAPKQQAKSPQIPKHLEPNTSFGAAFFWWKPDIFRVRTWKHSFKFVFLKLFWGPKVVTFLFMVSRNSTI